MRKDEIVNKNISLVFDFLRYITEHPELIEKIPNGCELGFLDKDYPVPETVKEMNKVFLKVEHTFSVPA
jgi:hypothetical protein